MVARPSAPLSPRSMLSTLDSPTRQACRATPALSAPLCDVHCASSPCTAAVHHAPSPYTAGRHHVIAPRACGADRPSDRAHSGAISRRPSKMIVGCRVTVAQIDFDGRRSADPKAVVPGK